MKQKKILLIGLMVLVVLSSGCASTAFAEPIMTGAPLTPTQVTENFYGWYLEYSA